MKHLEEVIKKLETYRENVKKQYNINVLVDDMDKILVKVIKRGAYSRDINICCKRYGLNGYKKTSFKDMEAEYELCNGRMREIVKNALRKGIIRYLKEIQDALPDSIIRAIITDTCPLKLYAWAVEEEVTIVEPKYMELLLKTVAAKDTLYIVNDILLFNFKLCDIIKAGYQLGVFSLKNNEIQGVILLADGDTITWDLN